MNKFRFVFLLLLFFAAAAVASAQATRTWVGSTGSNTNPCSRTAPCKSFAAALALTAVGGEIDCLDANVESGTLIIDKSITIDCEDTEGTLRTTVNNGIDINITDPNDTAKNVRIRGFLINGVGASSNGIRVQSASRLTLEEVIIDGFTAHGVSIENSSGAFNLVVKDSSIKNNGGNGINTALSGGATATIFVSDSLLAFNAVGLNQNSATTGVVQNSTFTGNTTGVQATSSNSIMALKGCRLTYNTTAVSAASSATIRIGGNIITGNGTALSGSNIYTFGSNFVDGNTVAGSNNGAAATQ